MTPRGSPSIISPDVFHAVHTKLNNSVIPAPMNGLLAELREYTDAHGSPCPAAHTSTTWHCPWGSDSMPLYRD
jgi:hypothetical protein